MDSSESSPRSSFDCTGTPSTGSVVLAAIMPGRCAAPPAPAMMALRPRPRAASAYSNIRSGVRWAETTLASKGTPKSSSILAAAFMVGQSELEPMMMPTTGLVSLISQS